MAYRFLKLRLTGDSYIESFLRRRPEYKLLPYEELYDLFLKSCVGWYAHYSPALARLGYDTREFCIDSQFLQRLWATEHGIKYTNRNWRTDIVSAQVRAFQPDIIFLDDLYYFDAAYRQFLRDSSAKPIKIIGWRAAPTEDYGLFSDVDMMLTCTPLFVDRLRNKGAKAELMMHAFEPSILNMLGQHHERDLDFTFAGNFVLRNGFHNERLALVKSLMAATNLEVWGTISERRHLSLPYRALARLTRDAQKVVELFGGSGYALARLSANSHSYRGPEATSLMRDHVNRFHEPVRALEYFRVLSRSKIILNKHIDCAENYAGNVRLFESTGMGACLVTDWKVNLSQMFVPDSEVITYRSPRECVEKVRYLLDHEDQLQRIAKSGQRRTLRDHTFDNRAAQLDQIIKKMLS